MQCVDDDSSFILRRRLMMTASVFTAIPSWRHISTDELLLQNVDRWFADLITRHRPAVTAVSRR